MTGTDWILLDTETSGLLKPLYCVEIAAQRMRGVTPVGEPFRALLNHDVEIDPRAESIHGYSRVFLRQHGSRPTDVHTDFIRYAEALPIVAFNLSFDWTRVLAPELTRLGLVGRYHPGFCALTLARRCIHETSGHGLQRLRAHFFPYHRGVAHRAMDDVTVTARLIAEILWPRLERAGVLTFSDVATFSKATPLAACRQRLGIGFSALSKPSASQRAVSSCEEQAIELEEKICSLSRLTNLEMQDVAALRQWLADHGVLQSELAMSCRGLLEISFGANTLTPPELERLQSHLGKLVLGLGKHGVPPLGEV